MRILKTKENISYTETQQFFRRRINKYNSDNPYSVTMYQDKHPELVKARNEKETSILIPKLELEKKSRILDVACGIGRWSDAITQEIEEYCGVDFCEEFIKLARERNKNRPNRHFYVSESEEASTVLLENNEEQFDRVLFIGSLMYLNDDDVIHTLDSIESVCAKKTIICIREPIGLKERLTLKEQFSEELDDSYSAIYRTRDELIECFCETLINKGFSVTEENRLFDETKLNNRKETTQYYFILKRY